MKRLFIILFSFVLIFSCELDDDIKNPYCDFKNYYYSAGKKIYTKEISGDYLLIGSDTINSNSDIASLIDTFPYFNHEYDYSIYNYHKNKYKIIIVKLKRTYDCLEVKAIRNKLKTSNLVDYVHYAIQTDYCYGNFEEYLGEKCIDSYSNKFYVLVKDTSNLSDLFNIIEETKTILVRQYQNYPFYFELMADKNSAGDAMQMTNYFDETGKFEECGLYFVKYAVE